MAESKIIAGGSDAPPAPKPPRQGKRSRGWWVAVGVVVVVGAVFLLRFRSANAANAKRASLSAPKVVVGTVTARKGDIGVYVNALGAVTPVYTVMVRSRVDGQLMNVNYTEGQMVRAGDLLVEIDPRPYQAQIAEADGQLTRDKALLENAHVDLERYQIAYSKNAIPKQQLDTQLATVHQYEGTVKVDQGQVENARLQLIYSRITAPISGRVGLRLVDPGNIVHATDSNPLVVITQLQPITVLFSVAEDYLPEIQRQMSQGQTLPVDVYDRAQQKELATGKLLSIDNQIDPSTGTVKIKAIFTNEDNALFPNQFVNVKVLVSTDQGATLIPTAAIQRNAQGAFVYVIQPDQTLAIRDVTPGPSDSTMTAVEGLKPGETIVSDNFNRLQEGMKVSPRQGAVSPRKGAAGKAAAEE